MKAFVLLVSIGLLSGCTAQSVGSLSYDKDGNAYRNVQLTTEYEPLCNGSCLKHSK